MLTWLMVGGGGMLLYSAIRQRSPLNVLADVIGGQHGGTDGTPMSGSSVIASGPLQTGSIGAAIKFAKDQLGDPYVGGANGPNAWDCSSLVQAAYAAAGITIPRTTFDQVKVGQPVAYSDLRPGDLIFTEGTGSSGESEQFGHVGMYLGAGQWIEAPHTGDHVKIVAAPTADRTEAIRRYINSAISIPNPFAIR